MKCNTKFLIIAVFIILNHSISASCARLIPSGEAVGVALQTQGLLVTGVTSVSDEKKNDVNCAHKAGLRKGDRILSVDGNEILTSEEFSEYIKNRPNSIALKVARGSEQLNLLVTPVKTDSGYRLGIWIRDSTAGIGTITYYNPENNSFAALGHGISDVDTNTILSLKKGNILKCNLLPPTKGTGGTPGALNGIFSDTSIGCISANHYTGIYGTYDSLPENLPEFETAGGDEIKTGTAYILSDVDGLGVRNYRIKINKIFRKNASERNMVIEVTDPDLIKKTGGIVQGMSGAPIIQNNKLIGAVTHVFVNNPKCGYAIFIENMLNIS